MNMIPSQPGDFIHTKVESGLNVTEAAEISRIRLATLSGLLNGNAALSPETARCGEDALYVSVDLLLRM